MAKDICEILDLENVTKAISTLDEDEKANFTLRNIRGEQRATKVITESGLYALVFKSTKPVAKQFRKWVTSEVLPSIRRQGGYSSSQEFMALHARYRELEERHERSLIREEKPLSKDDGACFYIFDFVVAPNLFKIGVTNKVGDRQRRHRTTVPVGKMVYIVYTKRHKLLEEAVKARFDEDRVSELIQGRPLSELTTFVDRFIVLVGGDYKVVPEIETEEVVDEEDDEELTKFCLGCQQALPLGSFHRDCTRPDGHKAQCSDCYRLRQQVLRAQR